MSGCFASAWGVQHRPGLLETRGTSFARFSPLHGFYPTSSCSPFASRKGCGSPKFNPSLLRSLVAENGPIYGGDLIVFCFGSCACWVASPLYYP